MHISHYSAQYGHRVLARDFSMTLKPNVVNILIGANGSGKTTLLDFIAGVATTKVTGVKYDVPKPKQIAYQLQQVQFLPTLTVAQTLKMYQELGGKTTTFHDDVSELISPVLDHIWSTKMGQLSGGERQLVSTYGQFLLNRQLYIFDEPTSNVDSHNTEIILNLIEYLVLVRHKVVLITTHHPEQLADLPTHIITLN
ncbi:ATP-binding cassette domain-containing protein [Leuconostoc citreum]|uniref:ABC transporter ATP-binding protein n=1 Tax=Leuconostoc citreum TaxID=33964 RepID=UPI0002466474|nr:ATP-binding cassette domain-containing protein [Leuconostoc citreum]MCS8588141.1 ATP-binding cassette domain-containing protein [Leuconostoc citreum]MCS8595540.1 ATP-binding cassette domain-containing protein [Leuconostoc citreum]MCS8599104.1 ATP-binding cassette domain-containing protein [Leuconostoc citreum]CCF24983.1 Taurine ABC superfamily ATP binding cassette transporter, ABC protein [Leuconostoc citreum LBAE C10]